MAKRLLIIDDALIVRELIKDASRGEGWEVVGEANNGQEAVEAFRQCRPDVTTLDLVMPEASGLEALAAIREEDPEAKVLIVSAIAQPEVLEEALRLGASDFIVKPFQERALLGALNKLYRRSTLAPVSASPIMAAPGGRI
jgi:two-component system chemotaxis response regulator CheY